MTSVQNIADTLTQDAKAELAQLRAQVDALMKERVNPALSGLAHQAEAAAHQAGAEMRHQAARVTEAVQEKPMMALAIAAAAGFVLAQLMRR